MRSDSEFVDRGRDGGPEIDFEWGLFEAPDLEVSLGLYILYIYSNSFVNFVILVLCQLISDVSAFVYEITSNNLCRNLKRRALGGLPGL